MHYRSKLRPVIASTVVTASTFAIPFAAMAIDPLHPLGTTTIESVIGRVIGAVLSLMGVVSFVVFIWSGFSWMIAAGNAEKIKVAKRSMVYATTGLIVCFGSYAILRFFLNTVVSETLKKQ